MHLDPRLQLWEGAQQGIQGAQVELVGEALDDALHQVLLRDVVLAGHHLLHDARLHQLLYGHEAIVLWSLSNQLTDR